MEKKILFAHQGIALFGRGFYLPAFERPLTMRSDPNNFTKIEYSAERRAANESRPFLLPF
jgi:hypothetical protein